MSKDIIVLAPNGRRQKVHCTPDTIILQVLEDVCAKQGFQPTEYDLKHHNHILDLTTSVRFSNLPNKATLEMVEAERKREETNVTVGLLLEDGERRTADFPPYTSLYDLVTSLAPSELKSFQHPTILYMRQEVTGLPALREKTLRQLGLLGGRAILRLLNKAEEAKQANVSSVYRSSSQKVQSSPTLAKKETTLKFKNEHPTPDNDQPGMPGPSNQHGKQDFQQFGPIKMIKDVIKRGSDAIHETYQKEPTESPNKSKNREPKAVAIEEKSQPDDNKTGLENKNQPIESHSVSSISSMTQENLERRLRIEEEVTFLGAQKAVAFMQPDNVEDGTTDLPDDFYELTIEEVRKLYRDLQQHRMELEETPLITASKRESIEKQTSEQRLAGYKNVVVRVQFPDHIILQGIFSPSNTIGDVIEFIKDHLRDPNRPFDIFTTPLKETLDPDMTLLQAKFVPCVHMHFKWVNDDGAQAYLKKEIYEKQTSSDAASLLASKYRAPSRRKVDHSSPETSQRSNVGSSSAAKKSKVPTWFKTK